MSENRFSQTSLLKTLFYFTIFQEALSNVSNAISEADPKLSTIKLVYFWIYAAIFGLLIDLVLFIVFFTKHRPGYIKNHVFLAVLVIVVATANAFCFFFSRDKFFENDILVAVDGLLIACFMLQMLLGIVVRNQMAQKNLFNDFYPKRMVHRINGLIIYAVGKAKLLYLMYYMFSAINRQNIYLIVAPIYILIIAGAYVILIIKNKRRANLSSNFQIKQSMANEELIENIINSIENYEFAHDDTLKSITSLNSSIKSFNEKSSPITPKQKWFAFEESVYRIPKIDHAGGNYFLIKSMHTDITFYLHGKHGYLVFDNNRKDFLIVKHKHSGQTNYFLRQNLIGRYARNNIYVEKNYVMDNEINEKTCLNLFAHTDSSRTLQNGDDKNEENKYSSQLTSLTKLPIGGFVLGLVQKNPEDKENLYIDLKAYWVKMIGKYFMLEFANESKKFGYGVLALNPNYLKLKANFLSKISSELWHYHEALSTSHIKALCELKDNEDDLTYSLYYPTFLKIKAAKMTQDFKLSNPLGLGIGFTPYSTGKYLILVKNDGIAPFIDLLEILYQKCLLEIFKDHHEEWIFGNEYRLSFTNGLSFIFVWVIEDRFTEWAKSLGLYHLQNLLFIQNKLPDKQRHIVKEVWVDNWNLDVRLYPSLNKTITHQLSLNKLLSVRNFDYDKIIVSGDDDFKKQLFIGSGLEPSFLHKVIFI